MVNLTRSQIDEILARHQAGETLASIAARFGVTSSYVSHIAKRCLMPARRPRISEEVRADILRRRAQGRKLREISRAVGLPYHTVRDVILRARKVRE